MPTRDQIYQLLFDWLKAETGITVIKADQKSPRPARPYASIKFLNPSSKIWDAVDQQSVTKTVYPAASGFQRVKLNAAVALDALTVDGNLFTHTAVDVATEVADYVAHFEAIGDFTITAIAADTFDIRRTDDEDFAITSVGDWTISAAPLAGTTKYHISAEGMRKSVASINVFGDDAVDILSQARDSLDRPDVVELFDAAGVSHVGDSPVRDLTGLLETEYEERGQMDLTVGFISESVVDVSTIEHVNITGTVNERAVPGSV